MLYRVRIGAEVVFAAGPQAQRRVPVPRQDTSPEILTFSREWRQLDELPPTVAGDSRLDIEARPSATASWHKYRSSEPLESPAATATGGETRLAAALRAAGGRQYAWLKIAAKALGIGAVGKKDALDGAVQEAFEQADEPVRQAVLEALEQAAAHAAESAPES